MWLKLWYLPCSHLGGKNNKHCTRTTRHLGERPPGMPFASAGASEEAERRAPPSPSEHRTQEAPVLTNPPFSPDTYIPSSSWPRLLHSFSVWRCHPAHLQQTLPKRSLSARHSAKPSGWDKQTRPRHPGKEGDAEGTPARRALRLPRARTSSLCLFFGSCLHLLPFLALV